MRSQEYQLQDGDCGDYWGVTGAVQNIKSIKRSDKEYAYDPSRELYTFSEGTNTGRHCIKNPDAEKPSGEWNTVDLYCHSDTSVHMVNGKVVMILYNSKQMDNGQPSPLTKDKLQIRSEGAEVFYKDIKLISINAIPVELLK